MFYDIASLVKYKPYIRGTNLFYYFSMFACKAFSNYKKMLMTISKNLIDVFTLC